MYVINMAFLGHACCFIGTFLIAIHELSFFMCDHVLMEENSRLLDVDSF